MNILVPLAGKDESFIEAFGDLKPFVDIHGTALIQFVLECLPYGLDRLIFVCLREHEKSFDVGERLKKIFGSGTRIVWADELTEGSACSALMAEKYIDNDEELLVDLADIYFDPKSLKKDLERKGTDVAGIIPIDRNTVQDRPWGYVYFDRQGRVKELREKELKPKSTNATLGLYNFSRGSDFVRYTRRMIAEGRRVPYNNLFYVGPVYNLFIGDGKKIATSDVKILHVFGSVSDVNGFLETGEVMKVK